MGLVLGLIAVPILIVLIFVVWQATQTLRYRRDEPAASDERAGDRDEAQRAARRRRFVEEGEGPTD